MATEIDDETAVATGPRPPRRRALASLAAGDPGLALLPLRLFLGVTFLYGGIQKLADPGFLHPGSSTYIGSQLHGFANHTPGGFILSTLAEPQPKLAGVGIALVEILVGLLVAGGLLTRAAAVVGLAVNLLLFLTASWHTHPYFLGSDIVFVFAWLPFALVGAAGQPALDHRVQGLARKRAQRLYVARGPRSRVPDRVRTRREVLGQGLGLAAASTGVIALLSALVKGPYRGSGPPLANLSGPGPAAPPASAPAPGASPPAGAGGAPATEGPVASAPRAVGSALPPGAVRLGSSSQLARGQAAAYADPGDGSPDLAIRHADGKVTALSAVCTHAGCQCDYQGGQVVCPCHGSLFDATTGAVITGPASQPLPVRRIVERNGTLYAVKV